MNFDLLAPIKLKNGESIRPERSIVFGSPLLWHDLDLVSDRDFISQKYEEILEVFYKIESARRIEFEGQKPIVCGVEQDEEQGIRVFLLMKGWGNRSDVDAKMTRIARRLRVGVSFVEKQEDLEIQFFLDSKGIRSISEAVRPQQASSAADQLVALEGGAKAPLRPVKGFPTEQEPYIDNFQFAGVQT